MKAKQAPIAKVWLFASESNPGKHYQTLQRDDGNLSCDCPGWTRRVARDGSRTCKHVRLVLLDLADKFATTFSDRREAKGQAASQAERKQAPIAERGRRVLDFSE